jgi:hypothetical protein
MKQVMRRVMKQKKGLTIFTTLFTIVIIAAINVNLARIDSFSSSLTLENYEAFSEESSEGGGFDCMKKKDDCMFKATLSFHFTILRKLKYTEAEMQGYVNLSDGTQIFYKKAFYWPTDEKVRCGTDVTCNAYQRQLGLIN